MAGPVKGARGQCGPTACRSRANEDGQTTDIVDIRRPVNIEMEYEVLEPGRVFLPYIKFHTQEGLMAFEATISIPSGGAVPGPLAAG